MKTVACFNKVYEATYLQNLLVYISSTMLTNPNHMRVCLPPIRHRCANSPSAEFSSSRSERVNIPSSCKSTLVLASKLAARQVEESPIRESPSTPIRSTVSLIDLHMSIAIRREDSMVSLSAVPRVV